MVFTLSEVKKDARPGDVLLTSNPAGIGKLIRFGESIEDCDSSGKYGHVAIIARASEDKPEENINTTDGDIYESVMIISKNHIDKYSSKDILIGRHKQMTPMRYFNGIAEVKDNIGQIYPVHRLIFHGLDMINSWIKRVVFRRKNPLKFRYMRFLPLDWPVCSELGAQFFITAGCETGIDKDGWRGVNPDDFYDAIISRVDLWDIIFEGQYFTDYSLVK